MSERDPSRGRETGPQPHVEFEIHNRELLRGLILSSETASIAHNSYLPRPIEELHMDIEGSDEELGAYSIKTHLLTPTDSVNAARTRQFLQQFASEKHAEPVLDKGPIPAYLLTSEGQYQYKLSFNDTTDVNILILETAGSIDPETGAGDTDHMLRIGLDEFDPAFDDFLGLSRQLIEKALFYAGVNNVEVKIDIDAPRELDEEDEEESIALIPHIVKPTKRLEELAGMEDVITELRDIIDTLRYPEVMAAYHVERHNGIFLYGPPGTGKTSLAEAMASEIGANLWTVRSSDIYGMWMGESEKKIQKIMDDARTATKPLVLLFDEVDTIIRSNGGSAYTTVAGVFKREVGRLSKENKNVIVMATSNKQPNEIDEALFRAGRFDAHIYVEKPNQQARAAIFGNYVYRHLDNSQRVLFVPEELDVDRLAETADDLTGAEINEILRKAITAKAIYEVRTKKTPQPFTTDELVKATLTFRKHKS